MKAFSSSLLILLVIFSSTSLLAQKKKKKSAEPAETYVAQEYLDALPYRLVGPFRGGRASTVTGVSGKPNLFYMGSTGGGVWRTTDAGNTWENISDGFFGSSIGAIAVSQSDNNVIYVGQGEETIRGNTSMGLGVWKSVNAGKTWEFIGLENSRHISRIRIHPTNPDIAFVAVMGDLYKDSKDRGVYKTVDGGKSWNKVLFADPGSGAIDLIIDPNNTRILYASTWTFNRTPYSLSSGGEGSKLWKSTDNGNTWNEISKNEGFPTGLLGIIGVTVSPANSDLLYAMVENEPKGGLYKSLDAGKTWKKVNDSRALRQRAWYYTRIYADPVDPEKVYVMNVNYHVSKDGGKSFEKRNAPHGDHHDLWIAPEDPNRMIIADDGGAQISFDAGENWTTYMNQPTAQFYRVKVDDSWPFRIYGAQQDNSAIRINHRSYSGNISESDWETTAGGESGHHAINPDNNNEVYGGSYGGFLTRFDHDSKEIQAINVWPNNPLGHGVEDMKYRFQWNFPIFYSPHDSKKLYTTSNYVHVSMDGGRSWENISPDLTTNDISKQQSSGGPITKDNTAVEYYCTIFAAEESALEKDLIWTGSDDGLIHVTKDGGANWDNVTPKDMPKWMQINSIEIDPKRKGGLYVAGTMYKSGDYKPYLYHTSNYGKSWDLIVTGIPDNHFTRVIRADRKREGLLYAGTEFGMYVSFNDGGSWQPFQQNLPIVPITDLALKEDFLVVATQGRSMWIIDDLNPLYEMQESMADAQYLFAPKQTIMMPSGDWGKSKTAGTNHPYGAIINYYLKELDTANIDYQLVFKNEAGEALRKFSSKPVNKQNKWTPKKGANRFVWNYNTEGVDKVKGMIVWFSQGRGPKVLPGNYTVELIAGADTMSTDLVLLKDPNTSASQEDLQAQYDFMLDVRNKLNEVNATIKDIRKVRGQLNKVKGNVEDETLLAAIDSMVAGMTNVEKALYQTQNRSPQDPLNFPIRLNNKYGHVGALSGIGQNKPTEQMYGVKEELEKEIDAEIQKWTDMKGQLKDLNDQLKNSESFKVIEY